MILRISSKGLSEYEERLLTQQVKMIKGATLARWAYVPNSLEAELSIVRGGSTTTTIAKGSIKTSTHQLDFEQPLNIPLRLSELILLVKKMESGLSQQIESDNHIAEKMSQIKISTFLVSSRTHAFILPSEDAVLANIGDIQSLSADLLKNSHELKFVTSNVTNNQHVWQFTHSLKALIWATSQMETPTDLYDWYGYGVTFKTELWPNFGEYANSPAMLRLAALYSRDFNTLEQGMNFAKVSGEEVIRFLQSCNNCGLGLTSKLDKNAGAAKKSQEGTSFSLLQRLRTRLGLGFRL